VTVREFLHANIAVIDAVYLDHEAGVREGICHCRCGYRASEPDWLAHVADKIADAFDGGPTVVELPLDLAQRSA
jgi:hypothetical protein